MKSAEIARELEDIDAMSAELERAEEVSPPPSAPSDTAESSVPRGDQEPVGERVPDPTPSSTPPAELSSAPADVKEEKTGGPRPSILPQTGKLLEQTSAALDLILNGLKAGVVAGGLTEKDDQLGHLSMIMGTLKKAKDQANGLLGK